MIEIDNNKCISYSINDESIYFKNKNKYVKLDEFDLDLII